MTNKLMCEACQRRPIELQVEDDDARQPYRVCTDCASRLRSLSLRPLEWFNLAALHGPTKHLLHDDFYTDNGIAQQSWEDVQNPGLYPAPTLEKARHDLERLLDYAMTLYFLDTDTIQALWQHDAPAVLASLRHRVAEHENVDVEACAYEICGNVLGPTAQEWIRARWANVRPETFLTLAAATAACLPFEEGFGRVTQILEDEEARSTLQKDLWTGVLLGHALSPFRSRRTLDWMERSPALVRHEDWGRVAALSHFSWPRAVEWLAQGRPLSHIALFAIQSCLYYDTVPLREQRPTLEEQATIEVMVQRLDAYYESDHVPRVKHLVQNIRAKMLGESE